MVQEREGLLNCAVWLSELVARDDPWSAVKRIARGQANWRRDPAAILSNAGLFAKGLHHTLTNRDIPRKLDGLELNCTVEQKPDPDSRITLSDRTDRHGVPLPRVHWCINEQEEHTVRRTAEIVGVSLARLGVPAPVLDDWVVAGKHFPPAFGDVAHHIGTTRMSMNPEFGVVDTNCQVHGVQGLFIAGSSVFPTGSHANPTQMIVALAVRLADTLKQRAKARAPTEVAVRALA